SGPSCPKLSTGPPSPRGSFPRGTGPPKAPSACQGLGHQVWWSRTQRRGPRGRTGPPRWFPGCRCSVPPLLVIQPVAVQGQHLPLGAVALPIHDMHRLPLDLPVQGGRVAGLPLVPLRLAESQPQVQLLLYVVSAHQAAALDLSLTSDTRDDLPDLLREVPVSGCLSVTPCHLQLPSENTELVRTPAVRVDHQAQHTRPGRLPRDVPPPRRAVVGGGGDEVHSPVPPGGHSQVVEVVEDGDVSQTDRSLAGSLLLQERGDRLRLGHLMPVDQ